MCILNALSRRGEPLFCHSSAAFSGLLSSICGSYTESDVVLFLLDNGAARVPDCSGAFVSSRPARKALLFHVKIAATK